MYGGVFMCMTNLNVSVLIGTLENGILNLNNGINVDKNEQDFPINIKHLSILLQITGMESKQKANDTDMRSNSSSSLTISNNSKFSFNNIYEVCIRLTESLTGHFKDLYSFEVVPIKYEIDKILCKRIMKYTSSYYFSNISLLDTLEFRNNLNRDTSEFKNDLNDFLPVYSLKILIRPKGASEWIIQTIEPLF